MAGTTDKDKIAEFLACKGATKCPPATTFAAQAAPLHRARRQHEARLTSADPSVGDHEVIAREQYAERRYLAIQGVR